MPHIPEHQSLEHETVGLLAPGEDLSRYGLERFRIAALGVATTAEREQLSLVEGALVLRGMRRPTVPELQDFAAGPDTPPEAAIKLLQFDPKRAESLGRMALLESSRPGFMPSKEGRRMELGPGVHGSFISVTHSHGYHPRTGTFIEPVENPHSDSKIATHTGMAVGPHVDNWYALASRRRLELSPRRVGLVLKGERSLVFVRPNIVALANAVEGNKNDERIPNTSHVRQFIAAELGELSCLVVKLKEGEGYEMGSEVVGHDSWVESDSSIAFWSVEPASKRLQGLPPWEDHPSFYVDSYRPTKIDRAWPEEAPEITMCHLRSFISALPAKYRTDVSAYAGGPIENMAASYREAMLTPGASAIFTARAYDGERWKIGAFAQASIVNGENWLNALYADEEFRGGGINQRLLEHALNWLPPGEVHLRVDKNALPAVTVYRKALFEQAEDADPPKPEEVHPAIELIRMKLASDKREAALNLLERAAMRKREWQGMKLTMPRLT